HVVYRQSLIFLHLSHFSQKNKAYLALEIDFVSDLRTQSFGLRSLFGCGDEAYASWSSGYESDERSSLGSAAKNITV
ncbi:MAG: hypothetical protein IJB43_01325, partial [Clostridia bacterium]|nr:hypothetical protein [Clostridia bacterium]